MKKNEEQKHFLALMARPGDYVYIDITRLDIYNGMYHIDLADIDAFTMNYSSKEIVDSIKRANLASSDYLNGTLVIQDNQKHKPLVVLDRNLNNGFQINLYLAEKLNDKEKINTIINKFSSIAKNPEISRLFAKALKEADINGALNVLFSLPYIDVRKLGIYLIEMRNEELSKLEKQELIRDRDKAA